MLPVGSVFANLMFRRWPPVFVAFDLLVASGEDVRARRKAVLGRLARGAGAGSPSRMVVVANEYLQMFSNRTAAAFVIGRDVSRIVVNEP
jgi:ATP-dependent DNA ligase